MTTATFPGIPVYTVSGVGPYPINFEFTQGALAPVIALDGVETKLQGSEFTVLPNAGQSGALTLEASVAETFDGGTLYLCRDTPHVQTWQGQSAREGGLEVILDRLTQSHQDTQETLKRAFLAPNSGKVLTPGSVPIINEQGHLVGGPTADQIAAAQGYAADAQAAAARWRFTLDLLVADIDFTYTLGQPGSVIPGQTVQAGPYRFEFISSEAEASETHRTTAGGVKMRALPDAAGWVCLSQFGVVYFDRSAAASNGAAINRALAYCGLQGYGLDVGRGVIFNSVPTVEKKWVRKRGHGMGFWQKQPTEEYPPQAATCVVMTGTGPKDQTLFGVSSCDAWGASRDNPSPVAGYNDARYMLDSYVNPSTSAGGQTLKPFSAAWTVEGDEGNNQEAWGSSFEDLRVMPDMGGLDGMGLMRSSNRDVTTPLSSGVWDVGLYLKSVRGVKGHRIQFVGQWRMRALLIAPHAKRANTGAAAYDCNFTDFVFSRIAIRSIDSAPVVDKTATSVDIPWADDHAFGADGDFSIQLSTGGRGGTTHTFESMSKITGGDYDILRLNGVTPDPTAENYVIARPDAKGGGTSEMIFQNGEIHGFVHGSLLPGEHENLGGIGAGPFEKPLSALEISGDELTEISFPGTCMTAYDTVAAHIHGAREVHLPVLWEMHNGARLICSPQRLTNPYTIHPSVPAATETLTVYHEPWGSTIDNGTLDERPKINDGTVMKRFTDGSDKGFFEPVNLISYRRALRANLDTGVMLVAPPGGRAGIGRLTLPPGYLDPDKDDNDWALFYDDGDDFIRLRKDMHPNTAGSENLGRRVAPYGLIWSWNFASFEIELADNAVATIETPFIGGKLSLSSFNAGDTHAYIGEGVEVRFDLGGSPGIQKTSSNDGGSVEVGTTALTAGTSDGVDGAVNIAATVNTLQIKNMRESTRIFRGTITF
ncbi:hypothetical protein [Roseovarius atlanticus]|uniref:hypothetical protein n=1 Tax=Roseovarius atlanticus TaxID=1641875 RepID=UPI001C94F73B|nr:hypothetical protein [Roseovarius atlanticus]MBY5988221.1 hypothetical protein [Roseovarius atlanticus]MBY6123612.1 hypothetical protein [Roseovarius atlanticus]MBY6148107.1 hypothetical protein [Roseovarius atlanticus]